MLVLVLAVVLMSMLCREEVDEPAGTVSPPPPGVVDEEAADFAEVTAPARVHNLRSGKCVGVPVLEVKESPLEGLPTCLEEAVVRSSTMGILFVLSECRFVWCTDADCVR